VFDELDPEELRKARARSNPFETIRGGFFLNRAAMKMANMDKVFDFMFTKPKDEHDVSIPVFLLFVCYRDHYCTDLRIIYFRITHIPLE
jgi:hypothetical protein